MGVDGDGGGIVGVGDSVRLCVFFCLFFFYVYFFYVCDFYVLFFSLFRYVRT